MVVVTMVAPLSREGKLSGSSTRVKAKRQDGSPLREDSVKELCAIGRRRAAHAVKNDVAAQNPDRM